MATLRVYSPREVTVTWGGVPIQNFAEGTAIEASRNTDNTTATVGMQGDVGITFKADKTGTIAMTIMQTGNSNAFLAKVQREQDYSGELQRADIVIRDPSGSVIASYGMCHIMTPSGTSIGDDQAPKTWTFFVEQFDYTPTPVGLVSNNGSTTRLEGDFNILKSASDAVNAILGS